jgi:phospholipase C
MSIEKDDPIKHVVLLMMENHSFDQMLGCLKDDYPDLEGIDVNSSFPRFNLDLQGNKVFQAPTDVQQVELDPKHECRFVLKQIENENSGFVTDFQMNVKGNKAADRELVMAYYLSGRLQALHGLGRNFTICDHWFSSLPGPTWPNRFFALSGTSSGRVLMPEGWAHLRPKEMFNQNQFTIFDRLNEVGKTWRIYYYDFPSSLLLNRQRVAENLKGYTQIDRFFKDVRDEKDFPAFVFIEPKYFGADQNDDHPPHNVFKAEKLIADIYNAIRSSPELWKSTLLAVVYDEHGGFYDHVEPPPAIPPDLHKEEWTFDRLGVRVPALLISPWVDARVEKMQFDHTSLLKYMTNKWGLGDLGSRTESANSIGIAINQPVPRENTLPFVRVPYSTLIPPRPDLEKEDSSNHHAALQKFAQFLAEEEDAGTTEAIRLLASSASWLAKTKAGIGKMFLKAGQGLTQDLDRYRKEKVATTTRIALKRLDPHQ